MIDQTNILSFDRAWPNCWRTNWKSTSIIHTSYF